VPALQHLTAATTMHRHMSAQFWLEESEAALNATAP
jgi:hypothetical protein